MRSAARSARVARLRRRRVLTSLRMVSATFRRSNVGSPATGVAIYPNYTNICSIRQGFCIHQRGETMPSMVTAIVLIEAERSAIARLGPALADVPGVAEAYSVTGEFDFVAILRVKDHEEIAEIVTSRLSQIPGILKTRTHVAFKVYSKHDLEAMFSVGLQEAR